MTRPSKFLALLTILLALNVARGAPLVGHKLDVRIDPRQGTIAAHDKLILPEQGDTWSFTLHRGLDPRVENGDADLQRTGVQGHLESFRLSTKGPGPVTLRYGGRIRHDLEKLREGMGRDRQWSRGTIGEDGVVLDGFSGWYPRVENTLQRFSLQVQVPQGWIAVSQGSGPQVSETADGVRVGWTEAEPQDDIYLIAAPFAQYRQETPAGEAQVYLRRADDALAQRYLDATADYLKLYSALIGPYPYPKFALVENFWETGYGMPSFTLLGPRVIRLPFIIHTSYPHEVLHNWWGNGVFVDYEAGNWSEGLTAYLSDHLLKEQRGQGAAYRRDTLKAYADYVRDDRDFPIRDFRGRHGSASQAIGYGKTLMLLHMLRRDIGDPAFVAALRRFYRDNRFRAASFDDLRRAFEQESGSDLADFFRNWTERTGAPEIALTGVSAEPTAGGYRLRGRIEQVQDDDPFPLTVPLVVHLEGGEIAEHRVPLSGRSVDLDLMLTARPLRLDADPRFDLFRHLTPGESPVTLSALFGADSGLIVLPADAPGALADGYRRLAAAWVRGSGGWEVIEDKDLKALPDNRSVWILGWSNRLAAELPVDQSTFLPEATARSLTLAGERVDGADQSIALVRERGGQPIGWVATGDPAALPGLARKLPHYGKYSYLVFAGQAPDNRVKGQWPVSDSALMVWLTAERPDQVQRVPPSAPLTAVLD